jgi:hypothetical protein
MMKFTERAVIQRTGYCKPTLEGCDELPRAGHVFAPGYAATPCSEFPVAYCHASDLSDLLTWSCHTDVELCLRDRDDHVRWARDQQRSLVFTDCFPSARPLE